MKKKTLIATLLLAVGIVLLVGSQIAAAIYFDAKTNGGTALIGGADFPTYFVVFRHAYNGLFYLLTIVGAALSVASIPVFLKKKK